MGIEQRYSSRALRSFVESASSGAGLQVLDLGQASGATIDFYSRFARQMYLEDLYSTVVQERAVRPIKADNLLERLSSLPVEAKLDLVCCWDVLNYLSAEEMMEVSCALSRFCHEGTMILALMHTSLEMAEQPLTFKIREECQVDWEAAEVKRRAAPCYTKRQLERTLPHFVRARSVLLRNGMEEQVYKRKAA